MGKTVDIETSVINYLNSRPGDDVIKSACQKITQSWWEHGRATTMSYTSPYVSKKPVRRIR